MRRRAAAAALGALLLAAAPGGAGEVWRRGDLALELSGSVREIADLTRGTDGGDFAEIAAASGAVCLLADLFANCPAFGIRGELDVWQSLTRARVRADVGLPAGFSALLVYDLELLAGELDTLSADLGFGRGDTFLGLEDVIYDGEHTELRQEAYRAYVAWEGERFEATVGRQRIPWGVGRLWSPIDRFNEIPPLSIEGDQFPGVDAVEARWIVSGFTYLQAVYAPGLSQEDVAYALRLHGVARDVDYSLVAGSFDRATTLGFDLATNVGDSALRVEAVWADPSEDVWDVGDAAPGELDAFWQVVVSWDRSFDVGTGLYVLVEHLYNGNDLGFGEGRAGNLLPLFQATRRAPPGLAPAEAAALGGPFVEPLSQARLGGSRVVTLARNQTGLQLGYDLTASLRLDAVFLWDWEGDSGAFFPSLAFTGWNSAELTVGVQVFAGGRFSQYGEQDPLLFVIAEWFF